MIPIQMARALIRAHRTGALWVLVMAAVIAPAYGQGCLRWVQITAASGPGQRLDHAMAYDSDRGVTVLFGGRSELNTPPTDNETWEYNGVTWRQVPITGVKPGPRQAHAMAYDAARREVVMLGGGLGGGPTDGGTWTYRGDGVTGTWTRHFPNPDPAFVWHRMVYDSVRQVVVSHGGVKFVEPFVSTTAETYEWNGTIWRLTHEDSADAAPLSRGIHAMSYDAARGLTVLFGGQHGSGAYATGAWQYNNGIWTQAPGGTPALRWGHVMAYDSRRNKIVMHGGFGQDQSVRDDTDEYAPGVGWTSLFDLIPPGRWLHAMVYDSRRGVMVLYGGSAGAFGTWDDTWELSDCCICNEPGWVDFRYTGEEQGTFDHPYNTLVEGIASVPVGGTLKIKTGSTAERPPLNKAMTLVAHGGPVTIGR